MIFCYTICMDDVLKLYVVNDPTPFPTSEYGGLFVVAAHSEEEASSLVWEETYPSFKHRASTVKVDKPLFIGFAAPTITTSKIVESFCT